MRVLFYSYPSAFQNPGGGEVQLDKTMQYLRQAGVDVKKFDQWNDKLEDFDIFHVFGSVKDCLGLVRTAKSKGVKIALSTIFWSDFRRAIKETRSFSDRAGLLVRQAAKSFFPAFPSARRELMLASDILFPNGEGEADQLARYFAVDRNKLFVVPNGVDGRFRNASPDEFIKRYGIKDCVLYVARIEPRKNQLNFIRAMKSFSERPIVFIGAPVSDYEDYYGQCREEASKNMHFLGHVEHDSTLLEAAYASCSVFALTSWFETPGLSALEAALSGANIVITDGGCAREYFGDMAIYTCPDDITSIRSSVREAHEAPKNHQLAEHVFANFTWDKVASKTIEGYEKILNGNS
ncbi:MAG: glycosyltransferase [Candidatus Omnitrophota bacterium]